MKFKLTHYEEQPDFQSINQNFLKETINLEKLNKYDDEFSNIQDLIAKKKKFLCKKQNYLLKLSKNNEFLDNIKDDYTKYHNYIIEQKNAQIKAFQVLNEYLEDLREIGDLTTYNIEDAKEEQKKILREISNIKNDLDNIIK